MAVNPYVIEKEINGKTYKAQFNGMSFALRAIDNSYIEGTTTTSLEKLSKYLLENVIVSPPNLTVDDFESMEEFNEVISFAREVMQGDFREKKDQKSTKATSDK